MRLAYIILAHKLPEQLVRLVHRLAGHETPILIHVDRSTHAAVFETMVAGLREVPDVTWLPRHPCRWGGFGYVRGMIEGVEHLGRRGHYDYAVLLSGQDYPIKPTSRIRSFLEERRGTSFLEHFALPRPDWPGRGGLERFEHRGLRIGRRELRLPDRRWSSLLPRRIVHPGNLRLYQGGTWWVLEQPCIQYVHDFISAHPGVVEEFSTVRNPAESFFQTVLMNSPLRERIVNDDVRFEDWRDDSDHPEILTVEHLEPLRDSQGLFARKFDISVDARVLDLIDQELLGVEAAANASLMEPPDNRSG